MRRTDHATPFYPHKLALTSPTSDDCSVGIVRSRTKATELVNKNIIIIILAGATVVVVVVVIVVVVVVFYFLVLQQVTLPYSIPLSCSQRWTSLQHFFAKIRSGY
jgi:hypothetical protein